MKLPTFLETRVFGEHTNKALTACIFIGITGLSLKVSIKD